MMIAALVLLADLQLVSVTPAKPAMTTDETFTVAVKVHNRGAEDAKDVKVTVGVNALSYLDGITAPKGWTCEKGKLFGYTLACTAPSFAKDDAAEIVMTLATPQHQAMTYRVGGRVQAGAEDASLQQAITLEATDDNAELSLVAKAEADHVNLEVRNAGPHAAKNVMVVLSDAAKASGRGWKCDGTVCTLPQLKKGATATLKVEATAIAARVRAEKNREVSKDNAVKVTSP